MRVALVRLESVFVWQIDGWMIRAVQMCAYVALRGTTLNPNAES